MYFFEENRWPDFFCRICPIDTRLFCYTVGGEKFIVGEKVDCRRTIGEATIDLKGQKYEKSNPE